MYPNIVGKYNRHRGFGNIVSDNTSDGVFHFLPPDFQNNVSMGVSTNHYTMGNLGFNASFSNAIYSRSNLVQPESIRIIYLIKF